MTNLSDDQSALVNQLAKENGFEEFEVHVEPGAEKGDNFMGIITNVSIRHDDKRLDLVMKTAYPPETPEDEKYGAVYSTEIHVYEHLFVELEILQRRLSLKHFFNAYPKIYGYSVDNKWLLMEDIRKKGFILWNKKLPMNPKHITVAIKEYAKFHSLGMIMKIKNPELFQEHDKSLSTPWIEANILAKDFNTQLTEKFLKTVKFNIHASEAIQRFADKLDEYNRLLEISEYKLTFIHADCWCNNMMFKYEDGSSAPKEVCFLDFQGTKAASPAIDLAYFLFCSLETKELENYEHYLKLYHSILTDNLKSANLDVEDIYPYSKLKAQFRLFAFQGLMAAGMVLQVILGENDEAPDIRGSMARAKKFLFTMTIANQEEYDRRIIDLILFMKKHDLFALN